MDPDWLHSDELGQSVWDCPALFQAIQTIQDVKSQIFILKLLSMIICVIFTYFTYFTFYIFYWTLVLLSSNSRESYFRLLIDTNALSLFYRERKNYYWKIFS